MEGPYNCGETKKSFPLVEVEGMRDYLSKRGMAYVTVAAIIVISAIIITSVYYFVFKGTQVSGLQKKYQTAKEASFGGLDVMTKEIISSTIGGTSLSSIIAGYTVTTTALVNQIVTDACFTSKLTTETSSWPTGCDSTVDAKTSSDIRFTLSGVAPASPYDVYAKIVDTVVGNSNTSGIVLEGMGTAESTSGMITSQHFPYVYRIEIQGEKQANPNERSILTVLYGY
ncbi:MAG TPA: hypothetical protein DDW17_01100 [Deltaproteobacteria bacterium]|nr:hypothetical protein [Deltaproteobacteria bacterium]